MAKYSKPLPCPDCGKPCWSSKMLKFHTCKERQPNRTQPATNA
jgi:hypothetical protein